MSRLRPLALLLAAVLRALPEWLVVGLPGDAGIALRHAVYRRRFRHLGRDVVFEPGVRIAGAEWISIGDNCWIDQGVVLLAGPPGEGGRVIAREPNPAYAGAEGELTIGRNVHVAAGAVLSAHGGMRLGSDLTVASGARVYSLTHHHSNPLDAEDRFAYRFSSRSPAGEQALISSPVVIGDAAAVGLNAVVLPGSTIGDRAWLGALSRLRGALPEGVIAAGCPAQVVGHRASDRPAATL